MTTLSVKNGVDTTHGVLWTLHFDQVDWLEETWLGGHDASIEHTSSSWDKLSTTSMDGVSVKGNIVEIESDSSHVLVAEDTFLGGPVETGLDGVLDFVEELDSLGDVDDHVGSGLVWSKAPNLSAVVHVPLVLLRHVSGTGLDLVTWTDLFVFDLISQTVWEWDGLHVKTVVLEHGVNTGEVKFKHYVHTLFGDLDKQTWLDSSMTVSRYETTGSDFLIGMQA